MGLSVSSGLGGPPVFVSVGVEPGSPQTRQGCILLTAYGQAIERTLDGIERLARDLEIPARGGQRRVAQQHLDGPEVDAGFQKMGGEGVSE
jgi:hypothetical protein